MTEKKLDGPHLKHIHDNFLKYKDNYKLVDFNDLINNVLNKVPDFDVVFIDEAQDLSPLQWKLYDKLKEKVKMYILQVMMTKLSLPGLVQM